MEQTFRIFFFDQLTDGSCILNGTCFIIYQDDAHQNCIRSDCISQFFQRDMAFSVYRQPSHFTAVFFQLFHGIFYGRMFDLCCDEVLAISFIAFRCTINCPVITFCTAACEEDLFIFCTDTTSDDICRISDLFFNCQTHGADRSRVAVLFAQHHSHFFRYGRQCSCCSSVIEINHLHLPP